MYTFWCGTSETPFPGASDDDLARNVGDGSEQKALGLSPKFPIEIMRTFIGKTSGHVRPMVTYDDLCELLKVRAGHQKLPWTPRGAFLSEARKEVLKMGSRIRGLGRRGCSRLGRCSSVTRIPLRIRGIASTWLHWFQDVQSRVTTVLSGHIHGCALNLDDIISQVTSLMGV